MNNLKTNISMILQDLIRNKGVSISELARRTKIPQPTIYRIVHGKHQRPHKKTLESLASFFKVSIDQITGIEEITNTGGSSHTSKIPIFDCNTLINSQKIENTDFEYIIYEKKIGQHSFALHMPDKSMEPLITKNSLLIIDPDKQPEYRNLVVVKLANFSDVLVRQLIKDAENKYIRPLNQDFNKFEMIMLTEQDTILGTIIEARLNCEEL